MQDRCPASISDVARAAGVSITTVSHVMSGRRPVNQATARQVEEVIRDLGYIPHQTARALATGTAKAIAVLLPDIRNPFFGELARGAEDMAEARGYSLVLQNANFDSVRELHYLNTLRGRSIDGLLYAAGAPPSCDDLAGLADRFPLVTVDEEMEGFPAPSFVSDNWGGGRLVADFLLELGHRSILVVSGPHGLASSTQRLGGFLDVLCKAGLSVGRDVNVVEGSYQLDGGYRAVKASLPGGGFTYTAVFALNDLMAAGALRALHESNLCVPGSVSVVGFDDIPLAPALTPRLTTVRQPAHAMGCAAASTLIDWVTTGQRPLSVRHVLDVELSIRDSAVAPT